MSIKSSLLAFLTVCAVTLGACNQTPAPQPQAVQGAPIDAPVAEESPAPNQPGMIKQAPTDPAARAALAVDAPKPVEREGFSPVTFDALSDFPYPTNDEGALLPEAKLPQSIADLNEKQVAVSGFLVPIEFQDDKVSSLILVRNQLLCCYGEEPQLNEWVFVNINPPVEPVMEVPVTLFGKFYASPDEEDGQVISLYRMDASGLEKMDS